MVSILGVTSYQDIGDCLKLVIDALRYGDIKPWVWKYSPVKCCITKKNISGCLMLSCDGFIPHRSTETAVAPSASSSCSPTTSRSTTCPSQVSLLSTCCWRWGSTRWERIISTISLVQSQSKPFNYPFLPYLHAEFHVKHLLSITYYTRFFFLGEELTTLNHLVSLSLLLLLHHQIHESSAIWVISYSSY